MLRGQGELKWNMKPQAVGKEGNGFQSGFSIRVQPNSLNRTKTHLSVEPLRLIEEQKTAQFGGGQDIRSSILVDIGY